METNRGTAKRGWKGAVLALGLSTIAASGVSECSEDEVPPHHPPSYYANLSCGPAGGEFITATATTDMYERNCTQVETAQPRVVFRAWRWDIAVDTVVSATRHDSASGAGSPVQVRVKLSGGKGRDSLSLGATGTLYPLIFNCVVKTPCL